MNLEKDINIHHGFYGFLNEYGKILFKSDAINSCINLFIKEE